MNYKTWWGPNYKVLKHTVLFGTHKAKRLVLQCFNGVSLNPVKGRTKFCQLKDLIPTLLGLIFRQFIC